MVRDMKPDERRALDDALLSRPGVVDEATGLVPPSWWKGEEDAARTAAAFAATTRTPGR
jgi:hypothetical protein